MAENTRNSRRASNLGVRLASVPKSMGLRETEEFISKIRSMNYDLQLSLALTRQQVDALREQVEKMETEEAEHVKAHEDLKAEHVEALKINDDLVRELERREQAIQEAVTIICQLEEKIENLESTSTLIVSSPAVQHTQAEQVFTEGTLPQLEYTGSASGPETPEASPVNCDHALSAITSDNSLQKSPRTASVLHRTPLLKPFILKSEMGSAGTLRSLYLAGENNQRESPMTASTTKPLSFLSGDEDEEFTNPEDYYRMRTPPLSILSKSSFPSIYGTPERAVVGPPAVSFSGLDTKPHSVKQGDDKATRTGFRYASRVHNWSDDQESPSKNRHISPRRAFTEPAVSIGSLLRKESTTDKQLNSKFSDLTELHGNVSVLPSPGTMYTTNASRHDDSTTLAHGHLSQEDTRPPSAESCDSELARIISQFKTPGWFGTPAPKPVEPISTEKGVFGLHDNSEQDSPKLPLPWTGNSAGRLHEHSSATTNSVPYGNNTMFNGGDKLPTEYGTRLPYKRYSPLDETPPRITRNMSGSSEPELSPAGRINGAEFPRSGTLKQTPSPIKVSQERQDYESPEAQYYQRLVTPPSEPRSTITHSDTESKVPHISSSRTTSSLSTTPLLPPRPKYSYHIFPRSQSQSIKPRETQQENFLMTQRQSLDVSKQGTTISNTAPSLLPIVPRPSLHQRAPASRIARPGTAGSAQPQRASSSIITRSETHAFSTATTARDDEVCLTPSTNSQNDSATDTSSHNARYQGSKNEGAGSQASSTVAKEGTLGRKWGKKLGRTASLKIRQSFGWKKGDN
ncbi:hypothetical protein MMC26_003705 [Xylographa opegraphella]|nr:hypothetical protein [Xylographa opegraphella]